MRGVVQLIHFVNPKIDKVVHFSYTTFIGIMVIFFLLINKDGIYNIAQLCGLQLPIIQICEMILDDCQIWPHCYAFLR